MLSIAISSRKIIPGVFWGHNTRFVLGLIGKVSLEFLKLVNIVKKSELETS